MNDFLIGVTSGLVATFIIYGVTIAVKTWLIPWVVDQAGGGVSITGKWAASWITEEGKTNEVLEITRQSVNKILGTRDVGYTSPRRYRIVGFYKDSLFVAHFFDTDRKQRRCGTLIARLTGGKKLVGRMHYHDEESNKIEQTQENTWTKLD